jgi:hypothetical protein
LRSPRRSRIGSGQRSNTRRRIRSCVRMKTVWPFSSN